MSGSLAPSVRRIDPGRQNQADKAPRLLADVVRQRLAHYREMQRCSMPPTKE